MKKILLYSLFFCLWNINIFATVEEMRNAINFKIVPKDEEDLAVYERWLETYNTSEASTYLEVLILDYYYAIGEEKKEEQYAKGFFKDLSSETDEETIEDKLLFLPPDLQDAFFELLKEKQFDNDMSQLSKELSKNDELIKKLLRKMNF